MLKCLELIGFKSFADKTRFEFDGGITGIVGPNGSGKSNVVDAIRWILGEQSPKSLRGSEMADVIFNGSATRRSLGMAEVSLTLDNRRGFLPIEHDDVVLTRRVYRSGEGEYLINGQLARLRDIKELFLGTGAGSGAYSIIEQGKVEVLLQSSTKDRRHIFEEAAGISRFRAKKIESLRRLDRVEQNLVRVQDIYDELDKQLRGLRSQAGKARRFKELNDELRVLRRNLGLADYHYFSRDLERLDNGLKEVRDRLEETESELGRSEAEFQTTDETLHQQQQAVQRVLAEVGEIREKISRLEAELASEERRAAEITHQFSAASRQFRESCRLIYRLEGRRRDVVRRYEQDELKKSEGTHRLNELSLQRRQLDGRLGGLQNDYRHSLKTSQEGMQKLSRLENSQSALESQLQMHWQQRERLDEKAQDVLLRTRRIQRHLGTARNQSDAVQSQQKRFRSQVSHLQGQHKQLLDEHREMAHQLTATRERQAAVVSRIDVLENLRQRKEGVTGGVKEALKRQENGSPVWRPVVGVLAECIEAASEYADLVELALGEWAEALLVGSEADLTPELLEDARSLPGRVRFLSLTRNSPERLVVEAEEQDQLPLSHFIDCEERFRPLIDRLLGETYIVADYAAARGYGDRSHRIRMVTRDGEVLTSDGRLVAGPRRAAVGILARGAELRQLLAQRVEIDQAVQKQRADLAQLDDRIRRLESRLGHHELRESTLADQSLHFATLIRALGQKQDAVETEGGHVQEELARIDREIAELDREFLRVEESLSATHDAISEANRKTQLAQEQIADAEEEKSKLLADLHEAQTEAALVDERLSSLATERDRLGDDLQQRLREQTEHREYLEAMRGRQASVNRLMLHQTARRSELYAEKDEIVRSAEVDPVAFRELRTKRQELAEKVNTLRAARDEDRGRLHSSEIKSTELRMQRDSLCTRMLEDFELDLAEQMTDDFEPFDEEQRSEARTRVEELRQKIHRLGNVNVHAVDQLEELELRTSTLKYQLDDLATARKHLEDVIEKINEESRRLFIDTFETVRGHFQEVFRHLFGGGKADLLLEDETDVLESGIEVIARPPGKEPRSISLLSGGEKSLAAVALLMALFRSKPSPFCILDEVDAALDESNIGRYVGVLRDFLDQSQFILITHSKVTMASADVLHGVTQRESGVSLRVSVRLEDVAEDGTINEETPKIA